MIRLDPLLWKRLLQDYPTAGIEQRSWSIKHIARDYSLHQAPCRPHDVKGDFGFVLVTHRWDRATRSRVRRSMLIARDVGLPFVVLGGGAATCARVEALATTIHGLTWAVIEGPFTFSTPLLSKLSGSMPPEHNPDNDIAAKRNFGLQLSRLMGWDGVFFLDDDIVLTKEYVLRALDLSAAGEPIVACNTVKYADNSVVVAAYKDLYNRSLVDAFVSMQAAVVRTKEDVVSFFPRIYGEDWLFVIPYLLRGDTVAWAGSLIQARYKRYEQRRAIREETGDILCEGLMRLCVDFVREKGTATVAELIRQADAPFWEGQVLRRLSFLQELIAVTARSRWLLPHRWRMHRALLAALAVVQDVPETSASTFRQWVEQWDKDLGVWAKAFRSIRPLAQPNFTTVIEALGATDRARWSVYETVRQQPISKTVVARRVSRPAYSAEWLHDAHALGVQTTVQINDYLRQRKLNLTALVRAVDRVRYDRPVRSLTGNKPVATCVILVKAFEDFANVTEAVSRLVTLYGNVPMHCVVWVVPNNNRRHSAHHLRVYRDHLVSRVMLQTVGTNMRVLSGVASKKVKTFDDIIDELAHNLALTYWMYAINSVDHSTHIINTQSEYVLASSLADLVAGARIQPQKELGEVLADLPAVTQPMPTREHDEQALQASHRRLLRRVKQDARPLKARPFPYFATNELLRTLRQANLSWNAIDDLHYRAIIHDKRGFDALPGIQAIACVVVQADAPMGDAVALIEQAVGQVRARVALQAEIMVCVVGAFSFPELDAFRTRLIQQVEDKIALDGVLVVSSLLEASGGDGYIKARCEALVRYEHWLANHHRAPKILWVRANPTRQSIMRMPRHCFRFLQYHSCLR